MIGKLNSISQIDHFDVSVGAAVEAHTAGHTLFAADMYRIRIRNFRCKVRANGLAKLAAFTAAAV